MGTTFSDKIYDDADRTSLVDTLSLTIGVTVDFRYHYTSMSYDDGGTGVISGNAGNYDFQEVDIGNPAYYYAQKRV